MLYAKCPICGEKATRYRDVEPLDDDEARSIKLEHEFNAYYEKRCQRLGIESDGPLPPEYADSLPTPSSLLG